MLKCFTAYFLIVHSYRTTKSYSYTLSNKYIANERDRRRTDPKRKKGERQRAKVYWFK